MTKKRKVLIIKTGFSETFTPEIQEAVVSLGDVVRTTALLHLYKDSTVIWLTSDKALPLLQHNPYIYEALPYNLSNVFRLINEQFDIVINLEKVPGICAVGDTIKAWQRYGFRFDSISGKAEAYLQSTEALYVATNDERKKNNTKHWLSMLYEMVGATWSGEGYVIPCPRSELVGKYDIGLNFRVGNKFENKAWKALNWSELYIQLVGKGYHATMQPVETNLEEYMRWVNMCKLIVTNDSLGLHLAIAFGIPVVGLFGPTPAKEIQPVENARFIQRASMDDITVDDVMCAVEELYNEKKRVDSI